MREFISTPLTEQQKLNISIRTKGKKKSDQGRENIRLGQIARRKREREQRESIRLKNANVVK